MWHGKLFHGRSAKVEAEWSVFQAQSLPVFVLFFHFAPFQREIRTMVYSSGYNAIL